MSYMDTYGQERMKVVVTLYVVKSYRHTQTVLIT